MWSFFIDQIKTIISFTDDSFTVNEWIYIIIVLFFQYQKKNYF